WLPHIILVDKENSLRVRTARRLRTANCPTNPGRYKAHQSGLSVRQIATVTGLSSTRVHQLLGSDEARSPAGSASSAGRTAHVSPTFRPASRRHAALLHSDPTNSVQDICRTLGASKATLYLYLAEQRSR